MAAEPDIAEYVPLDARKHGSPWEAVVRRFGGRVGVLAVFAATDLLLVWCGYEFKESISEPTVMWPAVGLLFTALWLSERSFWPALLAINFAAELTVGAVLQEPFVLRSAALFALANAIDAIVAACMAHWLITDRTQVRTSQTLQFVFATATGALAGALLGAWVNSSDVYSPLSYLHQLQIWAAGNWLGSLTVAPVVFSWLFSLAVPVRSRLPELALRSRLEMAAIAVLLVISTLYVFRAAAGGAVSLLQLPIVLVALLIYAAYRFPPRWAATLLALFAFICAELASQRQGPFVSIDLFMRAAQIQTFLATVATLTFVMSVSVTEMRIGLGRLRESQDRYRSFVELSTEAVWRVELDQPMPVSLPVVEQVAWLREHGRVAECSLSYARFEPPAGSAGLGAWRRDVPWSAVYEEHLHAAAPQNFSLDGLRFAANLRGKPHTFLTSFSGVVRNGCLLRIWGVARDVTELTDLNARLLREQERLKSYARQILTAEEKARRATAVDLHDGVGQSLVGMAMTLEVAREQAPPDVRLLVDEVRTRLRDVQERTRHMISDLSPPGLYDLGLVPALQWLALYMRGRDRLQVSMETGVSEGAVKLETRVLIFKLMRELLRNVVKHAGVSAAHVIVRGDQDNLRVEVRDDGKGFEWQMDMFGARVGGFGLWSIADRIHEAGGEFHVDTAPGRGARFTMIFPLRSAAGAADSGSFNLRSFGNQA